VLPSTIPPLKKDAAATPLITCRRDTPVSEHGFSRNMGRFMVSISFKRVF
jgi:hypothetical protein